MVSLRTRMDWVVFCCFNANFHIIKILGCLKVLPFKTRQLVFSPCNALTVSSSKSCAKDGCSIAPYYPYCPAKSCRQALCVSLQLCPRVDGTIHLYDYDIIPGHAVAIIFNDDRISVFRSGDDILNSICHISRISVVGVLHQLHHGGMIVLNKILLQWWECVVPQVWFCRLCRVFTSNSIP